MKKLLILLLLQSSIIFNSETPNPDQGQYNLNLLAQICSEHLELLDVDRKRADNLPNARNAKRNARNATSSAYKASSHTDITTNTHAKSYARIKAVRDTYKATHPTIQADRTKKIKDRQAAFLNLSKAKIKTNSTTDTPQSIQVVANPLPLDDMSSWEQEVLRSINEAEFTPNSTE